MLGAIARLDPADDGGPRGRPRLIGRRPLGGRKNLVADIVIAGVTPEEMARRFRLPLEAVQEALSCHHDNKDWIDAEINQVGRQLGLK